MPFYYEELIEEVYEGYPVGGYPSGMWSEKGTFGWEPQFNTLPTFEEYAQWTQPEFVSPSEVELNPRAPAPQPPPTKFSLPTAFLPAQSANAPQAASTEFHSHPEKRNQNRPNPKDASAGWKSVKSKQVKMSPLDEFWLQNGKGWERVKVTKKESKVFIRRAGMGTCMTGPECFLCGTKLSLDEIMNPGMPCPVCRHFN
ncbi:uncharacterized protein F4807DRAFT_172696 [Annulohypoxylon truncatum]|uniref:uncharacterized protein n=1 Tax=Annulohypoxylon truncatum TaxID=327061 RepID=UPI0020087574|nr:uncharacterized protein F4807DRAFT_172696 [Annulohypoxylon truncatum]KAI1207627.1 hypothetical protein F4807DRAFT_172696 [Annulohypoxylon truncatum]